MFSVVGVNTKGSMGGFLQTAPRPSISLRCSTHQFINSATKAANAHAQRQTQTRPGKANLWAPHLPTPQQRHAKSAAGSTPARRTRSRGQLPILPIFSTSRSGVGVGQKKQWAVSAAPPEQKANFPASFGLRHPSVAETLGTDFLSMSPGIGRTRGRPPAERREGRGPGPACVQKTQSGANWLVCPIPRCDGEAMKAAAAGLDRQPRAGEWNGTGLFAPTSRKPFGIGCVREPCTFHPCLLKLRHRLPASQAPTCAFFDFGPQGDGSRDPVRVLDM